VNSEVGALGGHASKGDPPAWVPLGLSVKLLDNGHVSVSNIDDPYGVCRPNLFQTFLIHTCAFFYIIHAVSVLINKLVTNILIFV